MSPEMCNGVEVFRKVTLCAYVLTEFTEEMGMARDYLGTMSQLQALSPQALGATQTAVSKTEDVLHPSPETKATKDADHLQYDLVEETLTSWQ